MPLSNEMSSITKHPHYIHGMTESIGFLISDTSRLMRRRFDERARVIGVTRAQWKVLFALSREEGLNQGALAQRLEVEAITLSRMIDRLAEAGMVERRHAPADRRAWQLYLTDKARPLLDRLRAIALDLTDAALDGVTPEDLSTTMTTLERMSANLKTCEQEAAHG